MNDPSRPAPGWYPNPERDREQRYWDGNAWTEHVAPWDPATQPQSGGTDDSLRWLVPVGRSGVSIAAGYLGLGCLFFALCGMAGFAGTLFAWAFATLTVLVSVRALRKAKEDGHRSGRAIFGLVGAGIAYLGGLIGLGIGFASLAPVA